MLRIAAAVVVLLAFAPVAHAQQDPEPEPDDRESAAAVERVEEIELAIDEPAPIGLRWEPRVQAVIRAGAGALDGDTINPGRGAMSLIEGTATGRLTRGRLTLEAPLDFGHRQTFGASLSESRVRGSARATWRFTPRIRITGELGLAASWKPDWPDPFQQICGDAPCGDDNTPMDVTRLDPTDRYSHWDRRSAIEAVVRPVRRQRIRIRYDYTLAVYKHDPMFQDRARPLHLAPWDRDTHRLDAVWRLRRDRYKLRIGAELTRRKYFYLFAGDATTGTTHIDTPIPNPNDPDPKARAPILLELRTAKPRIELEYEVHPSVVVGASYELELQQDTFDHYLSFVGHHPEVKVSWALPRDAELTASAELFVRSYGASGYDPEIGDEGHPPLAWGEHRAERRGNFELELHLPLRPHWSAVADARLAVRRTNYAYTIDWNYVNWVGWAGVEYRY